MGAILQNKWLALFKNVSHEKQSLTEKLFRLKETSGLLDPGPEKNVFSFMLKNIVGQLVNLKIAYSSKNSTDQWQFSDFENCTVAMCKGMSSHKEIHTKVLRKVHYVCSYRGRGKNVVHVDIYYYVLYITQIIVYITARERIDRMNKCGKMLTFQESG